MPTWTRRLKKCECILSFSYRSDKSGVLSVQKLILGFPDVRCANKYQFKYSKSGVKYNIILMIVVDLTPQCCSLKFSLIS